MNFIHILRIAFGVPRVVAGVKSQSIQIRVTVTAFRVSNFTGKDQIQGNTDPAVVQRRLAGAHGLGYGVIDATIIRLRPLFGGRCVDNHDVKRTGGTLWGDCLVR